MDVVVRTECGAVRGESREGYSVFLAIPYAAPLDGARRFQAPAPALPWDGVRDAQAFGSSVPQPTSWQPGDDSECLTVNVWTPDVTFSGLPVMVWIHGGACMGGTAATTDFDGAAFAAAGIVLVTLNYRVGYEGFGWVDDAPCNRGVLDQIAALRWVHDNITSFGGDPDAVTLIGQSAGASSIVGLIAADGAPGLFRRGIAQSPGKIFVPADEARAVSAMITSQLGVRPTADTLAEVPPQAIHAVQMAPVAIMSSEPARWTHPNAPYSLIIDNELFDAPPWLRTHQSAFGVSRELICGFTTDEARMFTVDTDLSATDPADTARACGLSVSAVQDYRTGNPGITDDELHALILSDALFRIPALWCAEANADAGRSTYLYEFAWPSPARNGALRACHGLDIPFTFDAPHSPLAASLIGPEVPPDFHPLSTAMRSAFAAFATTGDPGWPQFDSTERIRQIWKTPPALGSDSLSTSRRIWPKPRSS
ncbi:carboxylesterase/lipase family protein [Kutzneria albida]|uniref:Carboxylic ester hydrolase n=1 Tax=Kutzneria albida DSM 43870 TaxID=1449976 RepID=W5W4F4_9PSEU|nr:carboxylesterase family protein [Kutzneria albida]AHH95747.1 Carboxylesterase [Kutzneria albida DSM 43870]